MCFTAIKKTAEDQDFYSGHYQLKLLVRLPELCPIYGVELGDNSTWMLEIWLSSAYRHFKTMKLDEVPSQGYFEDYLPPCQTIVGRGSLVLSLALFTCIK